jgi:tetratricopeptide (TPR) repeat protein
LAVSGCSSVQGQIEAGRRDLLYGDPNLATAYFERAAEAAPDRLYFSVLPEGSLTYLGRAYYASGKLPESRQALERAVSQSKDDNLAKLYLGLVGLREGDRQRGVSDLESGLRGIHEWLDYVEQWRTNSYGQFWDPSKQIRAKIKSELAMISRGAAPQELIAGGEWVGKRIEEEIDEARRDESDERSRDGDSRSGDRP